MTDVQFFVVAIGLANVLLYLMYKDQSMETFENFNLVALNRIITLPTYAKHLMSSELDYLIAGATQDESEITLEEREYKANQDPRANSAADFKTMQEEYVEIDRLLRGVKLSYPDFYKSIMVSK